MRTATSLIAKELLHEIKATPEEYLPALLEIVRGFRHGIFLKPADESIKQGMKEALAGETLPVSELWKGIDASHRTVSIKTKLAEQVSNLTPAQKRELLDFATFLASRRHVRKPTKKIIFG